MLNREETINAILKAARKPCPKIVPAVRFRHKDTGALYLPCGVPYRVSNDQLERVEIGFVFYDEQNGTTYGTVTESEEKLRSDWEKNQDEQMDQFRKDLEGRDSEGLQSAVDYWLGKGWTKPYRVTWG